MNSNIRADYSGGTPGGKKNCCSILYAAYYSGLSSKHSTVLISEVRASPAWIDMVRQMNKDVVCDSIVWTDFVLTTDSVYFSEQEQPGLGAAEELNERGEAERPSRLDEVTNENGYEEQRVPDQLKIILRRYFYEQFCERLATTYGVPTLLTFCDNMKHGREMGEDDYNHQLFVDAMLSDVRFVAALEITRPDDVSGTERDEGVRHTEHARTGDDAPLEMDERREARNRVADESERQSVDSFDEFVHNGRDDHMFTEEDLSRLLSKPLDRVPTEISEKEMNALFQDFEKESERQTVRTGSSQKPPETVRKKQQAESMDVQNAGDTYRVDTSYATEPVLFPDDLVHYGTSQSVEESTLRAEHEGPMRTRQTNVPGPPTVRGVVEEHAAGRFKVPAVPVGLKDNGDGKWKKQNRFRELGNRPSKENTDTSENEDDRSVLSDISTEDERAQSDIFVARSTERRHHRSRVSNKTYARSTDDENTGGVRLRLVRAVLTDADSVNVHEIDSDTLVYIYRLERKSDNIVRFVRVFRSSSVTTHSVTWSTDDLLHKLRELFGEKNAVWLRRIADDPKKFHLKGVPVDTVFAENVPNLLIEFKRLSPTRRANTATAAPLRV